MSGSYGTYGRIPTEFRGSARSFSRKLPHLWEASPKLNPLLHGAATRCQTASHSSEKCCRLWWSSQSYAGSRSTSQPSLWDSHSQQSMRDVVISFFHVQTLQHPYKSKELVFCSTSSVESVQLLPIRSFLDWLESTFRHPAMTGWAVIAQELKHRLWSLIFSKTTATTPICTLSHWNLNAHWM